MTASTQELIRSAETDLKKFFATLESGGIPDMKGFDQRIKTICQTVENLPKKEAERYSKPLAELNGGLETLARRLIERKEALHGKIEGLDYNRKAQIAYLTADKLKTKKE